MVMICLESTITLKRLLFDLECMRSVHEKWSSRLPEEHVTNHNARLLFRRTYCVPNLHPIYPRKLLFYNHILNIRFVVKTARPVRQNDVNLEQYLSGVPMGGWSHPSFETGSKMNLFPAKNDIKAKGRMEILLSLPTPLKEFIVAVDFLENHNRPDYDCLADILAQTDVPKFYR